MNMAEELPTVEKQAYEFIEARGVVTTKQMPRALSGAVTQLERKGLVEIFKRRISPFSNKKAKHIRIKE
jgi:uncharacterized membrane protein